MAISRASMGKQILKSPKKKIKDGTQEFPKWEERRPRRSRRAKRTTK